MRESCGGEPRLALNEGQKEEKNLEGFVVSEKDWTSEIEAFLKLRVGHNEFDITGDPTSEVNKWGRKQFVFPTNQGPWRCSKQSPIAAKLAKFKQEHGNIYCHVVIDREGEGTNTKYTLVSITPMSKQAPISQPGNKTLTLEEAREQLKNLPESQQEGYLRYLKDMGQIKG